MWDALILKIIHYPYNTWDIFMLKKSCNIWDTLLTKDFFMVYLNSYLTGHSVFLCDKFGNPIPKTVDFL